MNAVIKEKANQPATAPSIDESKSKTDWERIRNMSDSDIEKAVMDDPDAAPILTKEEIKKRYKLTPPRIRKDVKQ